MTKKELDKLDRLAEDPRWEVRRDVAGNPNCPIEILDRLSRDECIDVRYWVARNPSCPAETLDRLSRDVYSHVRLGVAENPNCPVEILDRLSRDDYYIVRWGVAENPNCPIWALFGLINVQEQVGGYPSSIEANQSDVREAATKSLRSRKETATPEELSQIEEILTLLELGVRFDSETLDLSKIDI